MALCASNLNYAIWCSYSLWLISKLGLNPSWRVCPFLTLGSDKSLIYKAIFQAEGPRIQMLRVFKSSGIWVWCTAERQLWLVFSFWTAQIIFVLLYLCVCECMCLCVCSHRTRMPHACHSMNVEVRGLVSYFIAAVMDQVNLEKRVWAYASRGRVYNGRGVWQQGAVAESWEITSSLKHEANWKWAEAVTFKAHP